MSKRAKAILVAAAIGSCIALTAVGMSFEKVRARCLFLKLTLCQEDEAVAKKLCMKLAASRSGVRLALEDHHKGVVVYPEQRQ